MCKIRHFFSLAIFVWAVISWSSIAAKAQDIPDYVFLEVLDSDKKPVENAKVESDYVFGSAYAGYTKSDIKTDVKGNAQFYLEGGYYFLPAKSLFAITKDGYFPFNDLGFPDLATGYRLSREAVARVELLKIPQTKKEKRLLGDEQLKREFMWAAKTGDAATIDKLLKVGISPNLNTSELRGIPGPKDVPAIILAVSSANSETVGTLLKAGVKIRAADEPFRSILVTYLQADPFFWHKFKTESERQEILRRYENGVEILLEAGADFKVLNSNKELPIMIAAYKGYAQAVKTLLDTGYSPNFMEESGTTLLMKAANGSYENKYSKIDTVNLLLKLGADPNLSKNGCGSALGGAAYRGDIEVIQALLKKDAKVNLDCQNTPSALVWAVEGNKVEAAKLLIEARADLNALNNSGENILIMAAKKSEVEMVQMLLDKGFPVNAKNRYGGAALLYAIANQDSPSLELIKILLKAGASPNFIEGENKDLSTCFTPLLSATGNHQTEVIRTLAANGANVNLACSNGDTALVYAIKRHQPEVVKCLIELRADVKGDRIDQALNYIKSLYKEGDYERKFVDETIKIIEEARAKEKP